MTSCAGSFAVIPFETIDLFQRLLDKGSEEVPPLEPVSRSPRQAQDLGATKVQTHRSNGLLARVCLECDCETIV